jgi:hypothetical protein
VSTAAAVAAASTTVEAAAATATIAACATAIAASAATIAASAATITASAAASITARSADITASAVTVAAATVAIATAIAVAISAATPVVPRSDADKEAAREPARSVIAVGCASVGVIGVIAPRASRGTIIGVISGIGHSGANAHPDLGIRRDSGERQNCKHCQYN